MNLHFYFHLMILDRMRKEGRGGRERERRKKGERKK
jgi:hypothetical protein